MLHVYAIAAVVGAAVVFGAGVAAGKRWHQGELETLRNAYTQAALDAQRQMRELEARHAAEIDKVAAAARDRARIVAADAARARGELERLRASATAASQQCSAPATTAGGSTAAGHAAGVLAELLSECGGQLIAVARYADAAAAAGSACERAYREVTSK